LYLDDKLKLKRTLEDDLNEILFDPQTSGGLLIAVGETNFDSLCRALKSRQIDYWIVGDVVEGKGVLVR
jgi:selenide, water dikinase